MLITLLPLRRSDAHNAFTCMRSLSYETANMLTHCKLPGPIHQLRSCMQYRCHPGFESVTLRRVHILNHKSTLIIVDKFSTSSPSNYWLI